MTNESFYFNPDGNGLGVFLGPTEAALMELVWKHQPLSVKRATALLRSEKTPAYTTVMTILNRLTDKNILTRSRNGRNFEYSPITSRSDFIKERTEIIKTALKRNF